MMSLKEIPFDRLTLAALRKLGADGTKVFMDGDARVLRIISRHPRPSKWLSYLRECDVDDTNWLDILSGEERGQYPPQYPQG
jgi:hypothetical protein